MYTSLNCSSLVLDKNINSVNTNSGTLSTPMIKINSDVECKKIVSEKHTHVSSDIIATKNLITNGVFTIQNISSVSNDTSISCIYSDGTDLFYHHKQNSQNTNLTSIEVENILLDRQSSPYIRATTSKYLYVNNKNPYIKNAPINELWLNDHLNDKVAFGGYTSINGTTINVSCNSINPFYVICSSGAFLIDPYSNNPYETFSLLNSGIFSNAWYINGYIMSAFTFSGLDVRSGTQYDNTKIIKLPSSFGYTAKICSDMTGRFVVCNDTVGNIVTYIFDDNTWKMVNSFLVTNLVAIYVSKDSEWLLCAVDNHIDVYKRSSAQSEFLWKKIHTIYKSIHLMTDDIIMNKSFHIVVANELNIVYEYKQKGDFYLETRQINIPGGNIISISSFNDHLVVLQEGIINIYKDHKCIQKINISHDITNVIAKHNCMLLHSNESIEIWKKINGIYVKYCVHVKAQGDVFNYIYLSLNGEFVYVLSNNDILVFYPIHINGMCELNITKRFNFQSTPSSAIDVSEYNHVTYFELGGELYLSGF